MKSTAQVEREHWPSKDWDVVEPEGFSTAEDAWKCALAQRPDAADSMTRLVSNGGDRGRLTTLLVRVVRSRDWSRIGREDLKDVRKAIHDAWVPLERLKRSEFGREIFEKLSRADQLKSELRWLEKGLEAIIPRASGKRRPRYDSAVASLVRYVRDATKGDCGEDVSTLVEVARGAAYSTEAHREWCKRRRSLLRQI